MSLNGKGWVKGWKGFPPFYMEAKGNDVQLVGPDFWLHHMLLVSHPPSHRPPLKWWRRNGASWVAGDPWCMPLCDMISNPGCSILSFISFRHLGLCCGASGSDASEGIALCAGRDFLAPPLNIWLLQDFIFAVYIKAAFQWCVHFLYVLPLFVTAVRN